jgi:hypothetical protein
MKPRIALLVGMLGLLVGALPSCTNSSPSLRVVAIVPPPDMPIRFSSDVQPIFSRNCVSSGCHGGDFVSQGLNLEPGNSYSNLVNVPSTEMLQLKRVEPGRSDLSYLVGKLEGSGILGSQMPAGQAPLAPAEIQLIRDWIDQGAANN